MININMLKACMAKEGKTQEAMAKELGINVITFWRKVHGRSEFTLEEIKSIKGSLKITKSDLNKIFFS